MSIANLELIDRWIVEVHEDCDNIIGNASPPGDDIAAYTSTVAAAVLSAGQLNAEPLHALARMLDAARLGRRPAAVEIETTLNAALAVAATARDVLVNRLLDAKPKTGNDEITNAEFVLLTGLSKGQVSRKRKDGEPITIQSARSYNDGKKTGRRLQQREDGEPDADEIDEIERRKAEIRRR